jgi:adenylate cyclase
MERRLAAIMATDVVGYSRLIRADEEGTIVALQALRADLIDPKIAEHNGRIVKLMGDGMLVEFASVVDAVHAALETQQAVTEHNTDVPAGNRIELRIGINLGDVVIDGDDIQGDGINVAARLEGLAEPGGICISGMVYESVRDRIDVPFEDLGNQEAKNINRPVRVWRWVAEGSAEVVFQQAKEPLPLPEKPSIAVLPFTNLSGDPEQEYLADGIAEDLITDLSKIRWFFVIARNSTFTYKGQAIEVRQVSHELGVRYVLEGSIRKSGDRVRISAQLIDATTGQNVWAERYDREVEDIFELQDEMTQTIVAAVEPELGAFERDRALRTPPQSLDAWKTYQRGLWHLWSFTERDNTEALRLLRRARELDPNFAAAYAYEGYSHFLNVILGYTNTPGESLKAALAAAKKAATLDDNSPRRISRSALHWRSPAGLKKHWEHSPTPFGSTRAIH